MNGPKLFTGAPDIFNGITIVTDKQSWDSEKEFEDILVGSLQHWQHAGKRGIWIKIPLHQANLVGLIAKHDFVFHHAQTDYVMMTRWLPTNEPNMLPGYASHYIGVGGFVLNEDKEMLVIQEAYGDRPGWKLPGGTVDPGEDLPSAVVREVFEETGVMTKFLSVGCFRHLLKFRFGRSDIYFVCRLKPLRTDIHICPKEIAACKWMAVEEFLTHPNANYGNKYFVKRCLEGLQPDKAESLQPEMSTHQVYSILPISKDKESEEWSQDTSSLQNS